jgi:hypothetical protein
MTNGLPTVNALAVTTTIENPLRPANDTRVFDGLSRSNGAWLGTGTEEAILAAGGLINLPTLRYCPHSILDAEGWTFRAPPRS